MADRVRFGDVARRERLVDRHRLNRGARDVVDVARSVVALHSSDPATPHLAAWARLPGFVPDDLDRALCGARSLWRVHAMRRTLFVVPSDEADVFEAAASRDVAAKEHRRVIKWLSAEMPPTEVDAWLSEVTDRVLDILADGREHTTQELTEQIPELATKVTLGAGKWTTRSPLSSRLLFVLAMQGRIVRTAAAGTWRSSQYRWAAYQPWFGGQLERGDPAAARADLARRYLAAYGPATQGDLQWWSGWTATQTRAALEAVMPQVVALDDQTDGLVLDGDGEAPPRTSSPCVALLPGLDPTPMGYKQRGWYLGAHAERVYDRNGNVGPTVWVNGRIVGSWAQRPGGEVVVGLLDDLGADAGDAVAHEAAALTAWLDGVQVIPRFPSPHYRELAGQR